MNSCEILCYYLLKNIDYLWFIQKRHGRTDGRTDCHRKVRTHLKRENIGNPHHFDIIWLQTWVKNRVKNSVKKFPSNLSTGREQHGNSSSRPQENEYCRPPSPAKNDPCHSEILEGSMRAPLLWQLFCVEHFVYFFLHCSSTEVTQNTFENNLVECYFGSFLN